MDRENLSTLLDTASVQHTHSEVPGIAAGEASEVLIPLFPKSLLQSLTLKKQWPLLDVKSITFSVVF